MFGFYPWGLADNVAVMSHATAVAAFSVLLVLTLLRWKRRRLSLWLLGACAVTVLWAAAGVYWAATGLRLETELGVLELVRSAGWIGFVLATLTGVWKAESESRLRALVPYLIGAFFLFNIGLELAGFGVGKGVIEAYGFDVAIFGRLVVSVVGLLLVENLYRNTPSAHQWANKFLCIGVGALFTYDFFMYSEALLFQHVDDNLLRARGLTNALVVPLIAISTVRNRGWSLDLSISRHIVFHSATLVSAGIYLLLMAGFGYYLRRYGGQWGPPVQAAFLFAAIVLLLVVFFSGRFRAWLKISISKHFFRYKYDYREEWLKLIDTISSAKHARPLPERVVEAIAELVECPEGVLWLRKGDDRFEFLTAWNCRADESTQRADPAFIGFLEERKWVVDLDQSRRQADLHDGIFIPDWIVEVQRGWLIVPLLHHDRLTGLLLLGRPRVPRIMDWEDFDLLRTVGHQAASYLAEHEAAQTLVEMSRFDEFNRRFAFVIHDVKNMMSQLSLLLSNARKHKHNPAFQEDMIETVRVSVEKMNRLLVRLHESGKEAAGEAGVELGSLLRRMVAQSGKQGAKISLTCRAETAVVIADEERLAAVISHVIDNALEAASAGGSIRIGLAIVAGDAVVEVEDDGPGMEPEFIRNDLFRPFMSTKTGGYGIGAYESREYIEKLGGRLEVISEVGIGTTIRITLPTTAVAPHDRQPGDRVSVP